jgi:hypothetical protein
MVLVFVARNAENKVLVFYHNPMYDALQDIALFDKQKLIPDLALREIILRDCRRSHMLYWINNLLVSDETLNSPHNYMAPFSRKEATRSVEYSNKLVST